MFHIVSLFSVEYTVKRLNLGIELIVVICPFVMFMYCFSALLNLSMVFLLFSPLLLFDAFNLKLSHLEVFILTLVH